MVDDRLGEFRRVQGLMVALVTASRDPEGDVLVGPIYGELFELDKGMLLQVVAAFCGSFVGALETMEALTGMPVELTIQGMGLHNWTVE